MTAGAVLMVAGSLVFLVGAAIGVPRVFTERDPDARRRLLEEGRTRWVAAQPLYALGPLASAAGVGLLAVDGSARALFATAFLALFAGAVAWAWSTYQRGRRIAAFAYGTLPAWPFRTYVVLTIGGLVALGCGLLASGGPAWLGLVTIGAAVAYLVGYLVSGDLPPFVFYLLLLLVGAVGP